MAGLNLVPNPIVLVVQAGIFYACLVVVKKLFLKPYLKLQERRELETKGNKIQAEELHATNIETTTTIEKKLTEATAESRSVVDSIRVDAIKKSNQILEEAERESEQTIEKMKYLINSEIAVEKQKVPKVVETLAKEVYEKVLQ